MTATNHDGDKVYRDGHSNENVKKTNDVLLRNRQIHSEFTVIPSSENKISPSYVFGLHGLWRSLSNPETCLSLSVLLVSVALSAPSNVSASAVLTSDLGRVLVTWTTPDCTDTSGLIDMFIIEYCNVFDSRSNCTGRQSTVLQEPKPSHNDNTICPLSNLKQFICLHII